jgi:glycoside/pentoside/hexuronide:cation symporter, GPH family
MNTKLTLRTKLAYGVGDLGSALTGAMISVLLAVYLTDVVGLRPAYAALIIFIVMSWDYINDPIIGFLANRTKTRWGSYRPFLLFGALPFGLSFASLWYVPPIQSETGLFFYYLVAYFIYEILFTLVIIPYISMTPRLTNDYDERTSLTSYRMVFSLLGSMIAFVVPLAIIGDVIPQNAERIFIVGIAMAIISASPYLLTFLGTKETIQPPVDTKPIKLRESLKVAYKNKPFLSAVLLYLLTIGAFEISSVMTIYFFKYALGVNESTDVFLGIMFVAAVLSVPLWNFLSRKLDKTRAYIIAMVIMIGLRITIIVLPSGTPIFLLYLLMFLAGVTLAAGQTLPWAIIPDTIEYDEYLSGTRHEGVFYSMMQLARGIAVSLAIPGVLLLLDLSGYDGTLAIQSPGTNMMIRLLFGGVPVLLFIGGVITAFYYPLNRKKYEKIKLELEQRKKDQVHGT